jgi:hypothetical protein
MDKIRAWVEEKSREADVLFPGTDHMFMIIEPGDPPESYTASNMKPEELQNVLGQMAEDIGDDKEGQKKAN